MGHRSARHVPNWLFAALTLVFASCDGGAPTDAYELSGIVTVLLESGDTGGAIPDANVRFVSDTLLVAETTTDDSGRYRMTVMTDHPFGQVIASAPGFREEEATVLFDTPRRRVDLQLRRLPGEE